MDRDGLYDIIHARPGRKGHDHDMIMSWSCHDHVTVMSRSCHDHVHGELCGVCQCFTVSCLQLVAVCCHRFEVSSNAPAWRKENHVQHWTVSTRALCSVLQCAAVCCSVLWCVAMWCSVMQCDAVWCSVLQCVAVCCSVLQCDAACCSMLQCDKMPTLSKKKHKSTAVCIFLKNRLATRRTV